MIPEKTLTIGIDIDGTVTCPSSMLPHLNRAFGKKLRLDDCLEYNLANVYGIPEADMNRWFDENSEMLCRVAPVHEHADVVLRQWYEQHRLVYISARHEKDMMATREWFHTKAIPFHDIELIGSHNKLEAARRWQVNLFLEDRLENALQLSEELRIPVFLFDTPYNQAKLPSLVTRVHSWAEVHHLLSQPSLPSFR